MVAVQIARNRVQVMQRSPWLFSLTATHDGLPDTVKLIEAETEDSAQRNWGDMIRGSALQATPSSS
jgi:hypothetical protein